MPVKAGIHRSAHWTPAFAEVTDKGLSLRSTSLHEPPLAGCEKAIYLGHGLAFLNKQVGSVLHGLYEIALVWVPRFFPANHPTSRLILPKPDDKVVMFMLSTIEIERRRIR